MFQETIDGGLLLEMIIGAATSLEANKEVLNAMNVFPVPDGDTGTNMSLTLQSVLRELGGIKERTIQDVSTAMSKGALRGARGNSGVILSQIFRGLAQGFGSGQVIDVNTFAGALRLGADTAYKSVMKPKEGTMLTVIRAMSDEAFRSQRSGDNLYRFFDNIIAVGEATLDNTPNLNPVLKKANVVDAGGKGVIIIFSAFRSILNGEEVNEIPIPVAELKESKPAVLPRSAAAEEEVDINNPYCTEFFVMNLNKYVDAAMVDRFRNKLAAIGDSLVVVGDEDLIKVHVHTKSPGKALQYGLQLGELHNMKIENMVEQHRELQAAAAQNAEPEKDFGLVSVAAGEGISAIMKDLSVDEIILGGQTMNPSTEDILLAVEKVNAKVVYILPNNSNIILAAQQVQALTEKTVHVIPSKTIPQGMAAILAFNPETTPDDNIKRMTDACRTVKTGMVTYAVRDTEFGDKSLKEGDIIGLFEDDICVVGHEPGSVAEELITKMLDQEEMISLFYGSDVTEEQAEIVTAHVSKQHPKCEVSVYSGGQPLYYYIISVE